MFMLTKLMVPSSVNARQKGISEIRANSKPFAVFLFGAGVAVAFYQEVAHGDSGKITHVHHHLKRKVPGSRKTFAIWFNSMVNMATYLI